MTMYVPSTKPSTDSLQGFGSDRPIAPSDFTYKKGKTIFLQDDPAKYVYEIKSGAVRTYKSLPDGRRQINAFHLQGDVFGVDNEKFHRFTAEAIVQTTVRLVSRDSLNMVAENDAIVLQNLIKMTTRSLQRAENHMLLLGRKTALERTAAFLHEMDERAAATDVLSLPMSRRDIADYLGLTIETVSRAVSKLHCDGILDFIGNTQREIVILDRERLAAFDPQA